MDMIKSRRNYSLIAGLLFALVALVHLWRIATAADITVDGALVPMWVSWFGLVVTGILAYFGLHYGRRS
jgi:hypothetical protein